MLRTHSSQVLFSITPTAGQLNLLQWYGPSYPDGAMLVLEQGITVAREIVDLQFVMTLTDPPVPSAVSTWGAIKSSYR